MAQPYMNERDRPSETLPPHLASAARILERILAEESPQYVFVVERKRRAEQELGLVDRDSVTATVENADMRTDGAQ